MAEKVSTFGFIISESTFCRRLWRTGHGRVTGILLKTLEADAAQLMSVLTILRVEWSKLLEQAQLPERSTSSSLIVSLMHKSRQRGGGELAQVGLKDLEGECQRDIGDRDTRCKLPVLMLERSGSHKAASASGQRPTWGSASRAATGVAAAPCLPRTSPPTCTLSRLLISPRVSWSFHPVTRNHSLSQYLSSLS